MRTLKSVVPMKRRSGGAIGCGLAWRCDQIDLNQHVPELLEDSRCGDLRSRPLMSIKGDERSGMRAGSGTAQSSFHQL